MKIVLLLAVVVACFFLYRWQTQEQRQPVAVETPVPATPTPTPAPKKPDYRPDLSGRATPKSGTAPMTRSAEIQKELGLKGTSLDQRPRK